MGELFENRPIEPEYQSPSLRVVITREAAAPDEIVKEEPVIYDQYDMIEDGPELFNNNNTQISQTIKTRSISPMEAKLTKKLRRKTQTKHDRQSKPPHSEIKLKTSDMLPGTKFKCNLCKSVLCSTANLKRHHARFHGTKTYSCDICSKRFPLKYSLQIHKRVHTGIKPFECKICLRLFGNRANLRRHNESCRPYGPQIVQRQLFDRLDHFECYICKDALQNYEDLKTHMEEHAGKKMFRCNICRRMFIHQTNLVKHMHEHTMKKPYECDICNNTFTCSRNLKRHKRLHTRTGLYKCSRCPKEYMTKFSRDAHSKSKKVRMISFILSMNTLAILYVKI